MRFLPVLALASSLWSAQSSARGQVAVVDLNAPLSLETLTAQLNAKRVVFVGETHDRYDHHLN